MKMIKQKVLLPIKNFDLFTQTSGSDEKQVSRHSPLLPESVRCIVVGSSGSGKTNSVLSLILSKNGLRFKNIYIFCKTICQPKYRLLEEVVKGVDNIGFYVFSDNIEIMPPNEAEPYSIMIFDDVQCEKHNNIRSYFSMGRHNFIDVFYIGQSYSCIPKQLIRDNSNFLIVFKQDDTNLRHIFNDHVNTDMTFIKFKDLCSNVWSKHKFSFLCIDKESPIDQGRYRLGFDCFLKDI